MLHIFTLLVGLNILPPWVNWVALSVSMVNSIKNIIKSKLERRNIMTNLFKIIVKTRPVWNMGGIKQTHTGE
jgi:hypothetical protein